MELKHLVALVTIADLGSATRAAEALSTVQPALSRQIALLEREVGVALFERTRQGMRLTDAGRVLYESAQRALGDLDRARAEIVSEPGHLQGTVTVGLLASTAELLGPGLVRRAGAAHPDVLLRLDAGYAGHLAAWLDAGRVDLALLYDQAPSPGTASVPVVDEDLWVVGRPEDGFRAERPVALTDLVDEPFVLPSTPHGLRVLVERAFRELGRSPRVVVEANAAGVQRRLVLAGLGITVLPAVTVLDDLAAGALSAAPLHDPVVTRRVQLAVPQSRTTPRAVRAVADLLVAEVRAAVRRGDWPSARWVGPVR